MAALTAGKVRTYQGEGHRFDAPVAASTTIYQGAIVARNAAGYCIPAADTAGLVVLGIACLDADNADGSNGDIKVEVHTDILEKIATSVLVQADVGSDAVVADDQTVTDAAAATNDVRVGKIEKFETGFAWVRVGTHGLAAA